MEKTVYRQRSLDHGLVLSRGRHLTEENTSDLELPQMELNALVMATQNFSDFNKLGHGGFGSVYKVKHFSEKETEYYLSPYNL